MSPNLHVKKWDTWFVKFVGFLIIVGSLAWMGFAVYWHYATRALDWEYVPFVAGGVGVVFGSAILSRRATANATAILLPILDKIRPLSRTSTVLVPAEPEQPARVITTTVTPVPTDVTGTEFEEEAPK